jgi:hypothetical protein
MSKATNKIVATIGTYKDRQTGEEKKRYLTVGTAFTDDQGRISLKIDAMPVSPEWSGWLSLYPLDEDRQQQQQPRQKYQGDGRGERRPAPKREEEAPMGDGMEDDEIPF